MKSFLSKTIAGLSFWTLVLPMALILALSSVAYGLGEVIPQLDFGMLFSISMIAILIAWILASTKLRAFYAVLIALLLGIIVVLLRAGGLENELINTIHSLLNTISGQFFSGATGAEGTSPSWSGIQDSAGNLWSGIGTLLDRSRVWLNAIALGKPIFDPVATVLVWSLAIWMVSFWAGWIVQRTKRPLLGIAPAGIILAITLSYMLAETTALLILLGTSVFLLGIVQQSAHEKHWRQNGVIFHRDIRNLSLFFAATISLVLVLLAALTPSITIEDIVEMGKRWTSANSQETERVAESLGLSSSPRRERTAIDNVRTSGLPQDYLLGSGPELSENIVLQIRTLEETPGEGATTLYWRSITYDQYTGKGWVTGRTNTENYPAGQLVTTTEAFSQKSIHQEIEVVGPVGRLLFFTGKLVTVDQDFLLSQRSHQDIFGGSIDSMSYQVDSLLPSFNEDDLRNAGTDYPEWIRNRYLTLPESVPQRVRVLAQQLTATEATPYDRAIAIESYLRTFPYSLQVPSTSYNRDIADYFLFMLKRGFCGYYATSMAVLARAAGLPARIVIGYASNRIDEDSGRYIVTEADGHAWVEVYFPDYGWVEFEPTANRPTIPRILEPAASDTSLPEERTGILGNFNLKNLSLSLRLQTLWSGVKNLIGVLTLASLGMFLTWAWIDDRRLRLKSPADAVETLYRRLQHHARRLGVPFLEGDTPHEFNSTFKQHLNQNILTGSPLELFQPTNDLIKLYVQAMYTPEGPDIAETKRVVKSWGYIRRRLWTLWATGKVQELRKSILRR